MSPDVLFVMVVKQLPTFLPLLPRSPLGTPRLTLAPGRGESGATYVPYCTSQPALLSLPAQRRQLCQTSRPPGAIRNAPLNYDLQALAVRCIVLFPFRPQGRVGCLPSSSPLYPPKM